ncbi:MAG: hypothetical protein IJO10_02930 [Clostridia bacterium]|nr:hypothetical protein [Clostridia bacterium]
MKDHPSMDLIGYDGNIFFILARASDVLKRNGLAEESKEMHERVKQSGNYYKALGIISEYVQTEISRPDPGILEPEDIGIDPEFFLAPDGVTAYVETWFNTAERFGVLFGSDDSIDLYATYHPETEQFSAAIHIRREHPESTETRPVQLLPSERSMILREMEQCAEQQHTSLKELYTAWKSEQGKKQTHNKKKEKKHQHER